MDITSLKDLNAKKIIFIIFYSVIMQRLKCIKSLVQLLI